MENIILFLLALILPVIASININMTYKKYKKVNNSKKLTGFDVARKILDENGLNNMYIVEVRGNLTDHYDPRQKVVRLSSEIFHGETIAAAAVAAHECGHAIQDKEGYTWMKIRSAIYPIVNFGTSIAYILFFISILLQIADLLLLGIAIIILGLVFQIVTLPVEFDASNRALKLLEKYKLVTKEEHEGSKKVLSAAAMTYVAAVLSSLLDLIRLLNAYNDRN